MNNFNTTSNMFRVESKTGEVYVKNVSQPGMLLIYANWCGHCKSFMPLFKEICTRLGSNYTCIAIENSELEKDRKLASALNFRYFPTLKFFNQQGKIIDTYPESMQRSKSDILSYICKVYHYCVATN